LTDIEKELTQMKRERIKRKRKEREGNAVERQMRGKGREAVEGSGKRHR
jgi:hypothetical protein